MLPLALLLFAGASPAVDREAVTSALVERLVADGQPGLAVLVRRNGQTVLERGYGVRDLRTRRPIDPRTRFRLASVTKQMTAASIMLLVRDGRLRYEDTLPRALPGFPAYGGGVTIRHLLTHTSGLPDYEQLMENAEKEKGPIWTPERQIRDDEVRALLEKETHGLFAPGTRWAYSNSGYVLLGLVAARAAGQPFGEVLRERIFAPLGMTRTLAYEKGRNEVPDRAYGHTKEPAGFRETDQSSTSATLGDGGVYSCLEDLAKWDQALRTNALLSKAEMAPALTPVRLADGSQPLWPAGEEGGDNLFPGQPVAYGFGWFLDPWQGRPRVWHHGETMGFRSIVERFPADGVTVIVLANRGDLDLKALALEIAEAELRPAAPHQVIAPPPEAPVASLLPATFARVGTVDERLQSFNVEMVEVTGGRFWKPYGPELDAPLQKPAPAAPPSPGGTPAGISPDLFQYRPPIDLADPRLRTLAAGLGPAYVRVSGTWANSTYFADSDAPPTVPPSGFSAVLTRPQWKGVVDFARAVGARIVTSFATSPGTRDEAGTWTPAQARRLLDYTRSVGGSIAAAEFMNEPNFAAIGGAPAGYDAAAYGRDFKVFRSFAKQSAPDMLILGPGSVGEAGLAPNFGLKTRDLLAATGPGVDAFSYHHYGTVSKRCGGQGMPLTTPLEALSEAWLARTDATLAFYRSLRDEFEPGKPMWVTETADAACGGNPWGSSFLDTFRYLDQLGRLAKQGVRVVIHNTLAASDYGLLDGTALRPRPNYWAAWLWRTLMGATVLDTGIPLRAGLHTYAHCLRGRPGGVALLVINTDKAAPKRVRLPTTVERYTLSSADPQSARLRLNGNELTWDGHGDLPRPAGVTAAAGELAFAPATITFVAIPEAGNTACRQAP